MAAIAVAGVGLMVVCSSSLAAVMMMRGEEETPATTTPAGPAGPAAPTLPSGQYVKVVHTVAQDNSVAGNADDKNKILNLAELEVFAPGGTTSIAAGKTVEAASFHGAGPGANLVDGNMGNFAHTWGRTADDYDAMTVDLGSVQEIEKIKITNRVDCCKDRAIGIKVVILGADGTTVVKETPAISTSADTYTFTFPGTAWA